MSINIRQWATQYEGDVKTVDVLLQDLAESGYRPLIKEAKRMFIEVFGANVSIAPGLEEIPREAFLEFTYRRRATSRYRGAALIPFTGDLFRSQSGEGLLYLVLQFSEAVLMGRALRKEAELPTQLEIGYIGNDKEMDNLDPFITCVSESLRKQSIEPDWQVVQTTSAQFSELSKNEETKFTLASNLPIEDLELAEILEDIPTRELAITIRRAGGILSSDLTKKSATKKETSSALECLQQAGLITQEFVIICKKTSNQVNRVDSSDKIAEMTRIGVRCSCGNPISEERVEELIAPAPLLQRMLDQSYWMTARLVKLLKELQIPEDKILLNLQEGAEEIDAFVDLNGTLLMFELKDSQFSMGHAYPFGGRIGLYKPESAIIVCTKGIAPEVRDYFNRVKPDAELTYIGSLDQLEKEIGRTLSKIRSKKAQELISQFDPMINLELPLIALIGPKLGLEVPERGYWL